jgi:hypothetical protein
MTKLIQLIEETIELMLEQGGVSQEDYDDYDMYFRLGNTDVLITEELMTIDTEEELFQFWAGFYLADQYVYDERLVERYGVIDDPQILETIELMMMNDEERSEWVLERLGDPESWDAYYKHKDEEYANLCDVITDEQILQTIDLMMLETEEDHYEYWSGFFPYNSNSAEQQYIDWERNLIYDHITDNHINETIDLMMM